MYEASACRVACAKVRLPPEATVAVSLASLNYFVGICLEP